MATKTTKKKRRKRKGAAARGLGARQLGGTPPAAIDELAARVTGCGGVVLGSYREPLAGHWHLVAGLPIDQVAPTPFQRDLSDTHVGRLVKVIDELDRFVDPIIVVHSAEGGFWTPNGHHRLAAMRELGARAIVALVLAEPQVAFRILALNTEKAHNVREKSLEVVRMARALAALDPRPEREFAAEFEEASLVTLGVCYEQRGRFAGGAYQPVLRRIDGLLAAPLPRALEIRAARAAALLALDDRVNAAVAALKARGLTSPYLKPFVLARINPLRFKRDATGDFDETVAKMTRAAERFDAAKIGAGDLTGAAGPPEE